MERGEAIPVLIEKWSLRLKVGNWHVRFLDEDPIEDSRACNDMWHPKRVAVVRVHKAAPEAIWEECVLHEMLHVAFGEWVSDVTDLLERHLPPSMVPATKARLKEHEEVAIDKVSHALLGSDVQSWDLGIDKDVFWRAFPVRS